MFHAPRDQDSWVREQVKLKKSSDPLWKHVGFIMAQMDGLQAGVQDWAKKQGKKARVRDMSNSCCLWVYLLLQSANRLVQIQNCNLYVLPENQILLLFWTWLFKLLT